MTLHRSCAVALLAMAAAGCAAVQHAAQANRSSPASVAGGVFAPSRPANDQYGAPGSYLCPVGGVAPLLESDVNDLAKDSRKPPAQADGRLCAAADSFLGWKDPAVPPESVTSFTAWYFGEPSPILRVMTAVLDTEDVRVLAERLLDPLNKFAVNADVPRYGFATERVKKGITRVVLTMQDAALELQPFPRKLPRGGQARLEGKVLGEYAKTTVLVGDPSGKLETIGPKDGQAFAADVKCGDKPGVVLLEIRAERAGAPSALARFPLACGVEPAKSAPIPAVEPGPVDPAQAERKLLDAMNGERAAAGLPPLARDEAVAKVARAASEAQRSSAGAAGSTVDFDVVGALKKLDVVSPLVLVNPAAALTPREAHWRLTTSPVHRSNLLNPQATHAGVGIASQKVGKDAGAITVHYVTQLFVRELAVIDAEAMRASLRDAVAGRRKDARADPVKSDPLLEDVAQKYAAAMAAGKGKPPEDKLSEVVAPLYKAMRVVSVTAGTKLEPLEVVEEPGVVSTAKVFGVGVAQGFNLILGNNAVYVAIIVGTRK
jgi:uncharacterized protein YkwD